MIKSILIKAPFLLILNTHKFLYENTFKFNVFFFKKMFWNFFFYFNFWKIKNFSNKNLIFFNKFNRIKYQTNFFFFHKKKKNLLKLLFITRSLFFSTNIYRKNLLNNSLIFFFNKKLSYLILLNNFNFLIANFRLFFFFNFYFYNFLFLKNQNKINSDKSVFSFLLL